MVELARRRHARTIAIGHGRSAAAAAAGRFTRRWEAGGGSCSIPSLPGRRRPRPGCGRPPGSRPRTRTCGSWPDPERVGADDPAAAVVDALATRTHYRLRRPGRAITAVGLVGANNLHGLTGATADGSTWTVCNGSIQAAPQQGDHDVERRRLVRHLTGDPSQIAPPAPTRFAGVSARRPSRRARWKRRRPAPIPGIGGVGYWPG